MNRNGRVSGSAGGVAGGASSCASREEPERSDGGGPKKRKLKKVHSQTILVVLEDFPRFVGPRRPKLGGGELLGAGRIAMTPSEPCS